MAPNYYVSDKIIDYSKGNIISYTVVWLKLSRSQAAQTFSFAFPFLFKKCV